MMKSRKDEMKNMKKRSHRAKIFSSAVQTFFFTQHETLKEEKIVYDGEGTKLQHENA